jgi:hypothetical protein
VVPPSASFGSNMTKLVYLHLELMILVENRGTNFNFSSS